MIVMMTMHDYDDDGSYTGANGDDDDDDDDDDGFDNDKTARTAFSLAEQLLPNGEADVCGRRHHTGLSAAQHARLQVV